MKSRGIILRYLLLGGALAFAPSFLRKEWTATAFCDGFSLAGILLLSYGGLLFLARQDAFFGVTFLLQRIKTYFLPFLSERKGEGVEDFSKRRAAEKAVEKSLFKQKEIYSLSVGYGYLAAALIFLLLI